MITVWVLGYMLGIVPVEVGKYPDLRACLDQAIVVQETAPDNITAIGCVKRTEKKPK